MKNILIGILTAYILTMTICEIEPFWFFLSMAICISGLMFELERFFSFAWDKVVKYCGK